ncbi:MAG: signal recognition particle-docking protein FtsY [Thermoprotei archaeon]|nr:MAG: signal recognition particle-docking protein FtsY [Thermoprotei archaeon]
MFEKVRSIFTTLSKKVEETLLTKELSEEDFNRIFDDIELDLLESDVAVEAVEVLRNVLRNELVGMKVPRFGSEIRERVIGKVRNAIYSILSKGVYGKDIIELVEKGPKPYVVVFLGVNGVGKTTTIAKIAYRLKTKGLKSVVVAADTFRAGAQEQLAIHAKRLGLPFIKGKYGADPAAVAKDGVIYATKHLLDAVLIDTAGRMHTDVDLMNEFRKVVRVVKPHLKILVLDALTGNDAIEQAKWFDKAVGVDAVILTKLDADAKGGSALSIILTLSKPIIYVGVGQKYEDLRPYDPAEILNKLFE